MPEKPAGKQLSEDNGRRLGGYPIISAPDTQRAIVNLVHFAANNERQRGIRVNEVCWKRRDDGWLFRAKGEKDGQKRVAWGWADTFEDAVLLVGLLGTDQTWPWVTDKYAK